MRFLIAGLGSIGRRHLRNLVTLGERDVILYRTHSSSLADNELGDFPVETDLDAALARRPDAVIVSNPTALHLAVAIPAAEAGCHLFLEKPVSHSLARIDELRRAVQGGGGQVFVGFQFRFHPTLQAAAQLLAEGAIGRPIYAHAHWGEYLPNWHPWEDYRRSYAARAALGGGVVLTLCHPLDYLGWLLGRAEFAWAYIATLGDLGLQVEDFAEIGLRFPSGTVGSVHLDYLQLPPTHHLEMVGTRGSLLWDNATGMLRLCRLGGTGWENFEPPAGFDRNWLFLEEMRHFLSVANGHADPRCTLEDGIHTLEVAVQALASSRT
jgi:predicted dehydrogenase